MPNNLKGYWTENQSDGEKLICFKVRHRGRQETIKIKLAEIVIEAIKNDQNFAVKFDQILVSRGDYSSNSRILND